MVNTVSSLLALLGQRLPIGNGEEFRYTVRMACKRVYEQIGYKFIAIRKVERFQITAGTILLPEYVLEVLDAGFSERAMNGMKIAPELEPVYDLAFWPTPGMVSFPNLENQAVFLAFYKLPVDEKDDLIIPDKLYDACMAMAESVILPSLPNHPRYREVYSLEQKSLTLCDKARASYNKEARTASNRTSRQYR